MEIDKAKIVEQAEALDRVLTLVQKVELRALELDERYRKAFESLQESVERLTRLNNIITDLSNHVSKLSIEKSKATREFYQKN